MQKYGKFFRGRLCLITSFFLLSAALVYAQQIPHLIKYAGNLKELIEDKKDAKEEKQEKEAEKGKIYVLTFRIYNTETGGIPLWKETHPKVSVKNGEFEVVLGSINSLDLRFDEDYWLSIEIGNQGEIKPREKMTSFGYAYMSEDSYKLGGRYPDEYSLLNHSHLGEDIVTAVKEAINTDMVDGKHANEIGGVKDHGMLEGLLDDDHPQYLNELRGDSRYAGDGWDGLTKLETAQNHIADKNNPHGVSLEQLGHVDNNPDEEAPTVTERGEPTGAEIQEWADDITAWGHSNIVMNLNADKLDGKDSSEFSLISHLHTLTDISDVTSELRAAFLAAGAAGATGTNRLATLADVPLSSGLWTDEGSYIYPNNIGSNFQVRDRGDVLIAATGIIDATTANPKGTLTIGQSLAGNNIDYSVVIARHGTPPNPGIYTFTAPALLVQDFSGTVPSAGRDKDGLVRINAYRIGDITPNAANVTLLNVGNDEGEALRVDGLRNTFIGYGQKYPITTQVGSLFVNGRVGIGTTEPDAKLTVAGVSGDIIRADGDTNAWVRIEARNLDTANPSNSQKRVGLVAYGAEMGGLTTLESIGSKLFKLETVDAAPLALGTNGIERMRIDNTGSIGIGTLAPQNKLHLVGGLALQNNDPPGSGQNPGGTWNIRIDADGRFLLNANTPTPGGDSRMIIDDNNGYVGLGVNPTERLHVDGYVKAQGYKTGDIIFEKEGKSLWRMFEDEDGLYLENTKTGKVYSFVLQEVSK